MDKFHTFLDFTSLLSFFALILFWASFLALVFGD